MTQHDRILRYMETHGSITSRDAFLDLGVVSLPRRILDLKRRGHSIRSEYASAPNRYGETVAFKRDTLDKGGTTA